jgi:hypothetical protein
MGFDDALSSACARLYRRRNLRGLDVCRGLWLAAPNHYRFELVQAQPAGPGKTTVTVRLVAFTPASAPL